MGDDKPKGMSAVVAEHLAKPVYEDALQPAAKEAGRALGAAGSFLRVAVRPFQSFALGLHLGFDWLDAALREKLGGVPEEAIVEPPANVAGPLLLGAGFTSEKDQPLRDLYAQLLATAMQADTHKRAHPAFVEVLRQLRTVDALLLKALRGKLSLPIIRFSSAAMSQVYSDFVFVNLVDLPQADAATRTTVQSEARRAVQNYERLGLVHCAFDVALDDALYRPIIESALVLELKADIPPGYSYEIQRGTLYTTEFGREFLEACLGTVGIWK